MATTAPSAPRVDRRVLVRVPMHVGAFIDIICRLSGRKKKAIVDLIWAEGMRTVFGLTPDELERCRFAVPARPRVTTKDLRALTEQICGENQHADVQG